MPDLTATGQLSSGSSIMSTMWKEYPRWIAEVDFYHPRRFGGPADVVRLVRMARAHEVAILMGAVSLRHRYRDLVVAMLVKALPPSQRPRLVVAEATWEPQSRALATATRLPSALFGWPVRSAVRVLDGPHVVYCTLSEEELGTFPAIWGVDPDQVVFTPYPATMDPTTVPRVGTHLFAGGDSLRDYSTLETALEGVDVDAVMGCRWRPRRTDGRIRASYLAPVDFEQALASARMVVVPLVASSRSAGQQTYLNAMLMAKPTIASDTTGVRDYIEDGVTGVLVPPGDPLALRAAVRDVLDPARTDHYAAMGDRARRLVLERHLPEPYWESLIDLAGRTARR